MCVHKYLDRLLQELRKSFSHFDISYSSCSSYTIMHSGNYCFRVHLALTVVFVGHGYCNWGLEARISRSVGFSRAKHGGSRLFPCNNIQGWKPESPKFFAFLSSDLYSDYYTKKRLVRSFGILCSIIFSPAGLSSCSWYNLALSLGQITQHSTAYVLFTSKLLFRVPLPIHKHFICKVAQFHNLKSQEI